MDLKEERTYRAAILAPDGCEDTEIVALRDILLRSGKIEVDLLHLGEKAEFTTSHGLLVKADKALSEASAEEYDFVCLPGGKAGVGLMADDKRVLDFVVSFRKQGKLIAAICAAPSILGKIGLLDKVRYTCYPGFETGDGIKIEAGVVSDQGIVTGRSMYYTIPFAEMIVKELLGDKAVNEIFVSTRGISQ